MSAVYVWNNEQVVTLPALDGRDLKDDKKRRHLVNKFMVDAHETSPENRYGYTFNGAYSGWSHIPKEMFPKEFLIHLLLLDIQ